MKRYYQLLCFIGTLLVVSCGSDEPAPIVEEEKQITLQDVETEFSELDVKTGTNDFSLDIGNGGNWAFRAIAPDISDGIKKPLFIHLHGASGGHPDAHKSTACYMEPGLQNIEAYILSPNGGDEIWPTPGNQSQVLNLTSFAIKYWNVDPNKVVVVGYSDGGNGSWFFAETQPQIFSAGIPMASSYNTLNTNGEPRKIDAPLYVIHGENDDLFPLAETQAWVDQSIEGGNQIEFVVAPGLSHYDACDYVDYLQDAVSWLQNSVWK